MASDIYMAILTKVTEHWPEKGAELIKIEFVSIFPPKEVATRSSSEWTHKAMEPTERQSASMEPLTFLSEVGWILPSLPPEARDSTPLHVFQHIHPGLLQQLGEEQIGLRWLWEFPQLPCYEQSTCPICIEDFSGGGSSNSAVSCFECGHLFHSMCLAEVLMYSLKGQCMLCARDMHWVFSFDLDKERKRIKPERLFCWPIELSPDGKFGLSEYEFRYDVDRQPNGTMSYHLRYANMRGIEVRD